MDEDDYFAQSKRAKDDWDEATYYAQRLAGALLETTCPNPPCGMRIGALVIDGPDERWTELECPACRHRWTEES